MSTNRMAIKLHQIARMRVAGVKDVVIAQQMNLSTPGLARILALPEYQDLEQSILLGHVSKMDEALAGKIDVIRAEFKHGVPLAMRTMVEIVQQRRDLRSALAAASEILDRDPDRTYAKSQRSASQEGDGVANAAPLPADTLAVLTKEADKLTKANFAQPTAVAQQSEVRNDGTNASPNQGASSPNVN